MEIDMKHDRQRGFTLMEIIVATAVIGFIVVVLVQVFISTVRTSTKANLISEIKQNGDYATAIMTRMIQGAQSIDTTIGNDRTSIQITNGDTLQTTFRSETHDGVCKIASVSGYATPTTYYLTSSNVSVAGTCGSNLDFDIAGLYGTAAKVTFSFTLQQKPTAVSNFEQAQVIFQSSTELRNVDL
jgi:prepilin-type N-terminal cleavage/methylation domain-containing protein